MRKRPGGFWLVATYREKASERRLENPSPKAPPKASTIMRITVIMSSVCT